MRVQRTSAAEIGTRDSLKFGDVGSRCRRAACQGVLYGIEE